MVNIPHNIASSKLWGRVTVEPVFLRYSDFFCSFKFVALIYMALWVIVSAPLLLTDIPPLLDYPNHIARIHILTHLNDPALAEIYSPNWRFQPNLLFEAVAMPLSRIFPINVAGKIFLALYLLALPLAALMLHMAVYRRVSILPAITFLFVYHEAFLLGFLGFCLSMALTIACIAAWVALQNFRLITRIAAGAVMAVLLMSAHLYALGLYGLVIAFIELHRVISERRGLYRSAADLVLIGVQFIPVLMIALAVYMSNDSSEVSSVGFLPLSAKMSALSNVINAQNGIYNILPLSPMIGISVLSASRRVEIAPSAWMLCVLFIFVFYFIMPGTLYTVYNADWRILIAGAVIAAASLNPKVLTPKISAALAIYLVIAAGLNAMLLKRDWREGEDTIAAVQRCVEGRFNAGDSLMVQFWGAELPDAQKMKIMHAPTLVVFEAAVFVPTIFANGAQQPLMFSPKYQAKMPYSNLEIAHPRKLDWVQARANYTYLLMTDLRSISILDIDDWNVFIPAGVQRVCADYRVGLYKLASS